MSNRKRPVSRYLARTVALLAMGASCTPAMASCWEDAAAWYGVNVNLLYAIAKTESGLNPKAINRANRNGSYDIGMMQINSTWLPTLRKYGISESQLYDACTSIQVGAWILAQNIHKMGVTWDAVGAYNAKDSALRIAYAKRVYKNIPAEAIATTQEQELIVKTSGHTGEAAINNLTLDGDDEDSGDDNNAPPARATIADYSRPQSSRR